MPTAAFVSFRFGMADGVSVTAATWQRAFAELGYDVRTVAGEGDADVRLPWLAIDATARPDTAAAAAALDGATVVVVENVLTIPLNLPASRALTEVLRGRPALLHHYDPPWQRARFAHVTELPPDDPAWRHVTINHLTERELAARGIVATTIYSGFDLDPPPGDRARARARLEVAEDERLLLHPVRAIERKDVPAALALAEAVGGTYWLTGPAEEGYGPTLEAILARASTRVLRAPLLEPGRDARQALADAYAACDAVLFPSRWEGFGNPPIEAAVHRKPVTVGHYPVAEELRGLGFAWLEPDDPTGLDAALTRPDPTPLDQNLAVARSQFSHRAMRDRIAATLAEPGWLTPADVHQDAHA